jgi:hypothetical protein
MTKELTLSELRPLQGSVLLAAGQGFGCCTGDGGLLAVVSCCSPISSL